MRSEQLENCLSWEEKNYCEHWEVPLSPFTEREETLSLLGTGRCEGLISFCRLFTMQISCLLSLGSLGLFCFLFTQWDCFRNSINWLYSHPPVIQITEHSASPPLLPSHSQRDEVRNDRAKVRKGKKWFPAPSHEIRGWPDQDLYLLLTDNDYNIFLRI